MEWQSSIRLRRMVGGVASVGLTAGLLLGGPVTAAHAAETEVWQLANSYYGTPLVKVPGLTSVSSITRLGNMNYAVTAEGTVWRWGSLDTDSGTVTIKTPVQVAGLKGVSAIALSHNGRGYAVRSDGAVWGWDYREQLRAPAPIAGLTDIASISLGYPGCSGEALRRDGTVWEFRCDGYDAGAEVTQLAGIDNVKSLTAGSCDTAGDTRTSYFATKGDGTLWAWGDNRVGQLGDGTVAERSTPARVAGLTGVSSVTTVRCGAYAVTTNGQVWSWGAEGAVIPRGSDRRPTRLAALSNVAEVAAGQLAMMARTTAGEVWVWSSEAGVPRQVAGLTDARKFVTLHDHSEPLGVKGRVIRSDGTLWSFSMANAASGGGYTYSASQVLGFGQVTGALMSASPLDDSYVIGVYTPRARKLTATPVPKIGGTAKVGMKLTVKTGTWKPSGTKLAYQWYRGSSRITAATASSYTLAPADKGKRITVRITGSKTGYTTVTRTSKATKKVATGTLTIAKPRISGTARIGKTLTVKPGTWKPAPVTLSYQWYRSGTRINRATQSTYTLTSKDRGRKITVKVTGRALGYATRSSTSRATGKVR